MKQNPAKQLEQAARMAIVVLAVGSEERIALARALNALAAPKATKEKCLLCAESFAKGEEQVGGFVGKKQRLGVVHRECADEYRQQAAELAAWCEQANKRRTVFRATRKGTLTTAIVSDDDQLLASGTAVYSKPEIDTAAMSKCACGHDASSHRADELENLLECEVIGCECERFHYQIDDDSEQEAA